MNETGKVLVAAVGIAKSYGSTAALLGVDLEIRAGEVHGLVGENGAGKSTLIKILSGLEAPDRGSVILEGVEFSALSAQEAQRRGLLVVPQQIAVAGDLTVEDNLFLNRWPRRGPFIDRASLRARAKDALLRVGVTHVRPDDRIGDCSYVDKQLIEIARATDLFDPRIIILDEPTAALSVREIEMLFGTIQRLTAIGVGVLFVSHFLAEVLRIADRITVLRDGVVVSTGPKAEYSSDRLVHDMVGSVPDLYPRRNPESGQELLAVRHAAHGTIRDLSITVRSGEIVGLAAPKGEGISEFLRALCRISGVRPTGEILYRGAELRGESADVFAAGVGYLSEERGRWGLISGRSVRENLTIASLGRSTSFGLIRLRDERARGSELVRNFMVKAPTLEASIEALSGGNQQKVLLGRLFAANLSLYILDDPTFGVDVRSKAEINHLLAQAADAGAGILLFTSDLGQLVEMSDRLYVVTDGIVALEEPRGGVRVADLERILTLHSAAIDQ